MNLGRILCGVAVASGTAVLVAGALLFGRRKPTSFPPAPKQRQRQPAFRITRSGGARPQWVLQGFGPYACTLRFDSWQDAMNQARFQLETLGRTTVTA